MTAAEPLYVICILRKHIRFCSSLRQYLQAITLLLLVLLVTAWHVNRHCCVCVLRRRE